MILFDPCSIADPRLRMPGVLDLNVENNQLNMVNFTSIDSRTANVAKGLDPGLAGQLLSAQEQALRSEANALHTEVLDRQREALVSEARDRLAFVEQPAAEEILKGTFS